MQVFYNIYKMYHQPSKRRQQIKLFLTYCLMVTAVVGIVSVLVLLIQGYRYDGKIERDGLVHLNSRPTGAKITIDGQENRSQTSTRLTLPEGEHHFEMSREGYRSWKKTENLDGGTILWLNYARLIPNELKLEMVDELDESVVSSLASPNDEKYAVLKFDDGLQLDLYDIRGDSPSKKTLKLNSESVSASTDINQKFSLMSWSEDSRYLLVKHSFDKTTQWLVLDTRSDRDNVVNINTLLGVAPSKVEFRPSNSRQLYILEQGNLRRADIGSETMTGPMARTVGEFSVASDGMITFVGTQMNEGAKVRVVGYVTDGSSRSQVLRTFTNQEDDTIKVASGRYFSERYLTLVVGKKLEILKADLANSDDSDGKSSLTLKNSETLKSGDALDVTMRTKGRFGVVQFADSFATYDIELEKFSVTPLSGKKSNSPLSWIDSYMMWHNTGETLMLYEFDGKNPQNIVPVANGHDVTLSPNGKYMYVVTETDEGALHLSQIRMVLN